MCSKRLSVIVPGYNTRREWWVRCIASIDRALTDEDEILVVDDGSKIPVEREWFASEKVRLIRHEKNLGLPSGRNSGLDAALGRFVTFVDSDDEVMPGAFDRCIAKLEEYGADVAVYGIRSVYLADKFQVLDLPDDKFYGALTPTDIAALVKRRLFYYSCNKVFRRSFIDEHQMRFDPEGVPQEDAIFNVALVVNKAKWVCVAVEGYRYYRYDGTICSSYKPTYAQGVRACTNAWRKYKAMTPGGYEALGSYDETSDDMIVRGQWLNIWRPRSPYRLRGRFQYAKTHRDVLGPPIVAMIQMFVKMLIRNHLYVGVIRKRHQKAFLRSIGAKIESL